MMRISSISIVGGAALAACFGSGPTPTPPSEAQVVFGVQLPGNDQCSNSTFVGAAAIGAGQGYAVVLPYTPSDGNCNNGGMPPTIGLNLAAFPSDGSNPGGMPLQDGQAGSASGNAFAPAIATAGSAVAFAYFDSSNGQPRLGPWQTQIIASGSSGPLANQPVGLALDGGAAYIASINFMGGMVFQPTSPTYPCCAAGGGPSQGSIERVDLPVPMNGSATPTTLDTGSLLCNELKNCLASNTSSLYYFEPAMPTDQVALLTSIAKTGGPATSMPVAASSVLPSSVPVGLDANDSHVAYAFAPSATSGDGLVPGCTIFVDGRSIFQSSSLACMDLALDGDAIYFAIVKQETCDNCGTPPIHGVGIGRLSLDGQTFESIAVGVTGTFSGPRQVFVDPQAVYAVDPLAVARFPKSALDGMHDIAP